MRVTLHATPIKVSARLGSLELSASIRNLPPPVSVISPFVCPVFVLTLQRIEVYILCVNGDTGSMHFFRSALSWP
jgi:hypothetical protein